MCKITSYVCTMYDTAQSQHRTHLQFLLKEIAQLLSLDSTKPVSAFFNNILHKSNSD